jgi:hypothetical protein
MLRVHSAHAPGLSVQVDGQVRAGGAGKLGVHLAKPTGRVPARRVRTQALVHTLTGGMRLQRPTLTPFTARGSDMQPRRCARLRTRRPHGG